MIVHVYAPRACLRHRPGDHPESPERCAAIHELLVEPDVAAHVRVIESRDATDADLELVHAPAYIARVRAACEMPFAQLDPDTYVGPGSLDAALAAAGAAVAACDAVIDGKSPRAFCAVRPPGHHALPDRSMGFCLFNNVAIAARHLSRNRGIRKILIVDFDVHHGNGTEDVFATDPDVFFWSLHRWPFWPGSGGPDAPERVATLDTPLPSSTRGDGYVNIFRETLTRILASFEPEFVLVSAGFDAFVDDPIGGLGLVPRHFEAITREIVSAAERFAGGRVVSVLEGGYSIPGLTDCVRSHLLGLSAAS